MFTKGKNPVINSVVYCKTAPAAGPSFLLFLVSTCLKKIRRNIYRLWPMFHIPFRSHVSTVLLYLELVSSVYPDENHWTVVRLRLDLPLGASLVPSNRCVSTQSQLLQPRSQVLFTVVNSKEDLGTRLKQSPMYNFLSVPVSWILYRRS